MSFYRMLLRLLPSSRRDQVGEQMAMTFGLLASRRRGGFAMAGLWVREIFGILKFAGRERGWFNRAPHSGPGAFNELRWAWRSLRGNPGKSALLVTLLATALAANTVVFSAADSFVFKRAPFKDVNRLVEIGRYGRFGWSSDVFMTTVSRWRAQTDTFSELEAYASGPVLYLNGDGEKRAFTELITPGLFHSLSSPPKWGRSFDDGDLRHPNDVVIISEGLARQEFGDPAAAVGQHINVTGERPDLRSPVIVGVTAEAFRFPSASESIWLPLEPDHYDDGHDWLSTALVVARLRDGISPEQASRNVGTRLLTINPPDPRYKTWTTPGTTVRSIAPTLVDSSVKQLFYLLCGAALSLLLIAMTNIVNLQLTTVAERSRMYSMQIALGARRANIVRGALTEGALLIFSAWIIAAALVVTSCKYITTHLPAAMTSTLTNNIDLDLRAAVFMAVASALMWLLASLPVAFAAGRNDLLDALKSDARTTASSVGQRRLRNLLVAAEIALTVILLIGGTLSARSYATLLHLPKGFDSNRIVYAQGIRKPGTVGSYEDTQTTVLNALKSSGMFDRIALTNGAPPSTAGSIRAPLQIDGDTTTNNFVGIGAFAVNADYFDLMGVRITKGRAFAPGEPASSTIIDEEMAAKFWPGQDPVGHRFTTGKASVNASHERIVVGVSTHVRTRQDSVVATSGSFFAIYIPDPGPELQFIGRLRGRPTDSDLASIKSVMKTALPGGRAIVERADDVYAKAYGSEMLAAAIMSAFSVVAFIVAVVGVYSVMAFLVAGRTREIGVRIALGANSQAIRGLVLGAALQPIAAGTVAGLAGAAIAGHWIGNQIYGVTPYDPMTYIAVAAVVIAAAAIATWQPAQRAARVDPSLLLRD